MMTFKDMILEIQVGDVINGEHAVVSMKTTYATTDTGIRFCISNHNNYRYEKVLTVHRDGVKYFERAKPGGYRHGVKGGKQRANRLDPDRKCKQCGKVITDSLRRSYCNDECFKESERQRSLNVYRRYNEKSQIKS